MAVYTEVSDAELADLLDRYRIGSPLSLVGIQEGVENTNFFLTTTSGRYVLTLYEKRVDPGDLPYFMALMTHLSEHGVRCPLPVTDKAGQVLHELQGRPAAIFTFLEGAGPKRITPTHCKALGKALAELHLATEGFTLHRHNDLSVEGWRALFEKCRAGADRVGPGLADEIEAELAALEAEWPTDLPAGTIHADLFPDNVFFKDEGEVSGIIDFYFACSDFFAYDIAICLNAWCFEPDGQFNVTKARLMLAAYRKVRPFSDREMAALPLLAQGAAMRFLLTRLHDWLNQVEGALVKPKDPREYLGKLRFHRDVKGPGAYGLD